MELGARITCEKEGRDSLPFLARPSRPFERREEPPFGGVLLGERGERLLLQPGLVSGTDLRKDKMDALRACVSGERNSSVFAFPRL